MGLAVNARLGISNEGKAEHSSFQMLIPALTVSPIKDDPDLQMNASIHLKHSFACSAFSMTVSYNV